MPVKLHGRNIAIETFAFLDDGSSLTFIEERHLVEQLGLDRNLQPLCLKCTNYVSRMEEDSKVAQVTMSNES